MLDTGGRFIISSLREALNCLGNTNALQHQEDPPVVHPGIRAREIGKRDTSILTQRRAVDDGRCFNFEDGGQM